MNQSSRVYPEALFPVESLVISSGSLSATLHKNEYNSLHVDWIFGVGFKPLEIGGQIYETGLGIEIESRDIRRLEQFSGMYRHDQEPDFNIGSFSLFDHRVSQDTHFRVHAVEGNKIDIEAQIKVDLGDSYIDPKPELQIVHVRTKVSFKGILVASYSVQCDPEEQKLMRVANDMFDTSAFALPRRLWEDKKDGTLNLFFDPLPVE